MKVGENYEFKRRNQQIKGTESLKNAQRSCRITFGRCKKTVR